MDGDLQDEPEELPRLLAELDQGYDLVSGWKVERRDPWSKTLPSKLFNFVTSRMSGLHLKDFNCGFKLYRRDVVESVDVYGELHRFIPVLAAARGFLRHVLGKRYFLDEKGTRGVQHFPLPERKCLFPF